nr:TfoX/Sxy family protein [Roseospira navarrensis]
MDRAIGAVEDRRMFAGVGLFRDGLMIAILYDETFYLRTDAQTRPAFEDAGLEPFTPHSDTRRQVMPYHRAPDAALEDPEALRPWAEEALAAARRAATKRPAKGSTRRTKPAAP